MKENKTDAILNYLKTTSVEVSADDIASHLGYRADVVRGAMSRAFKEGIVTRIPRKTGRHYIYFYRFSDKNPCSPSVLPEKPTVSLSERIALMDAPVFNAVKRRMAC